jgi:hypothetical protein
MTSVFISYRRSPATVHVPFLRSLLVARLGEARVFRDVDSIEAGDDWIEAITGAVERADVVLAVIGPGWADAAHPDGRRRLEDAGDWVRVEIATAFELGKRVIPVLIGGAPMPAEAALPEPLRVLRRRQGRALRDGDDFARDVDALIASFADPEDEMPEAIEPGPSERALLAASRGGVTCCLAATPGAIDSALDGLEVDAQFGADYRDAVWAEWRPARTPGLAAELVRRLARADFHAFARVRPTPEAAWDDFERVVGLRLRKNDRRVVAVATPPDLAAAVEAWLPTARTGEATTETPPRRDLTRAEAAAVALFAELAREAAARPDETLPDALFTTRRRWSYLEDLGAARQWSPRRGVRPA